MTSPFIIYALPRSRTKWLSVLLTHGDWKCHHEIALGMRTWADVLAFFRRPGTGTAETAAAPGWRLLHHHLPDQRAIVVRRPVDEVVPAIMQAAKGTAVYDEGRLRRMMTYGHRMLEQVAAQPGVLSVDFADLAREECCAAVFGHCLGQPLPRDHWAALRGRNIQVRYQAVLRYYHTHRAEVEGFKRACRTEMRALALARAGQAA
jgi:hypothetical protein